MPAKPEVPFLTRRSAIAGALGLAAAGACGKFGLAQPTDLPDAAEVLTKIMPQAAPALVFHNAQGKRLTLADYAGHALVVNLWATWCGPCADELPSFAALAPQLRASGGLVLPISIDQNGADTVKPFFASNGIHTLPVLLDPTGTNMQVLNTDGVPVTIVVNAAGQMVGRIDGAANWDTPGVVALLNGLGGTPRDATGFIPV